MRPRLCNGCCNLHPGHPTGSTRRHPLLHSWRLLSNKCGGGHGACSPHVSHCRRRQGYQPCHRGEVWQTRKGQRGWHDVERSPGSMNQTVFWAARSLPFEQGRALACPCSSSRQRACLLGSSPASATAAWHVHLAPPPALMHSKEQSQSYHGIGCATPKQASCQWC
jgi:hypothetical protein